MPARQAAKRSSRWGRARHLVAILARDVLNVARYGPHAPRRFQLAWVDPREIRLATRYFPVRAAKYLLDGSDRDRSEIATLQQRFIAGGDWDLDTVPIDRVAAVSRFKMRLATGQTWEQAGEVEWMMRNIDAHGTQDGCSTRDQVLARCQALDDLHRAWAAGRVLTQQQMHPRAFRERGGIGVAVGRGGELIWMEGGSHRLALAQHLGLARIPACLFLVHREALSHPGLAALLQA